MNSKTTTKLKRSLSKLIPNSDKLRYLTWLPKLEDFNKTYAKNCVFVSKRIHIYDYIQHKIIKDKAITYLEFGVFEGASLKYWLDINKNSESKFYGFDTFTGLPESWDNFTGGMEKGTFDLKGELPNLSDKRLTLIKGMFQETLPKFIKNNEIEKQLIINNDSDLYSSSLFLLTAANKIIKPGTIIIFDEFSSILHEFRALEDYCNAYLRNFEVIAATKSATTYFAHVAIRIL